MRGGGAMARRADPPGAGTAPAGAERRPLLLRGPVLAWACYDWASSAFATTVLAGFFPVFFKSWWHGADVAPAVSTARLGATIFASSLLVAVVAPLLGAIADGRGARKRLLAAAAGVGVLSTAGLWFVPQGTWLGAAVLYGIAVVGFVLANVFYDSLLADVCAQARTQARALVSGFAFALGYLGGGLLLAVNMAMTLQPALFALPDAAAAVRASFPMVALWWTVFSLPLLLVVRERRGAAAPPGAAQLVRSSLAQLVHTWRELRATPGAALFLLAYWLYIDGVFTVIRMAVDYGLALGFAAGDLLLALLITQAVGFPATLALGWLAERVGARSVILLGLAVYTGSTLWAAGFTRVWEFYLIAAVIGLVQGTVQAASRAFYSRFVPPGAEGRYFGLYGAVGRFAAVLGPGLVAATVATSGNSRAGIAVVAVLFVVGGALLSRVSQASISRAAGCDRNAAGDAVGP